MAMRDFVNGADCAGGNPITNLVRNMHHESKSETQQDVYGANLPQSFADEEEAGFGQDLDNPQDEGGFGFQTSMPVLPPQFFDERHHFIDPYEFDRREKGGQLTYDPRTRIWIRNPPRHQFQRQQPVEQQNWADDFQHSEFHQHQHGQHEHPWSNDFVRQERQWAQDFRHPPNEWAHQFQQHQAQRQWADDFVEREKDPEGWAESFREYNQTEKFNEAWDGKKLNDEEEEESWYENFKKEEEQRKAQGTREAFEEISKKLTQLQGDPKMRESNFVQFIDKLAEGKAKLDLDSNRVVEHEENDWASDFNQQGDVDWDKWMSRSEPSDEWVRQFNTRAAENGDQDWVRAYQQHLGNIPAETSQQWVEQFKQKQDEIGMHADQWIEQYAQRFKHQFDQQDEEDEDLRQSGWPSHGEYEFTEENPYAERENALSRGIDLLNRGDLTEAILAFEGAVRADPQNANAWRHLGVAQAQAEKDDKAISALRRCLGLNPGDQTALLSISVSYTNEMKREEAIRTLESWLQHNPKYKHIKYHNPTCEDQWGNEFDLSTGAPVEKMVKVINLYLQAAAEHPVDIDEDVQIALGLLFNISTEFEKAVECFAVALDKRPDDYLLLNKLGATLANAERPEEAIGLYIKALGLNPNYIRARANLGISLLHCEKWHEAAVQFLTALSQQPEAEHLWPHLKTCFSGMSRLDLLEKIADYDVDAFRDEFDF